MENMITSFPEQILESDSDVEEPSKFFLYLGGFCVLHSLIIKNIGIISIFIKNALEFNNGCVLQMELIINRF